MFRATVLPIIRSIRLYNAACGMNHPVSCLVTEELTSQFLRYQTTHWVIHITSCIIQSNAPDDGQNCCPKHIS